MYTMSTCSYCKLAKELLSEYGVTPEEIVINADPTKLQELITEMQEKTGLRTVPQIFINDHHVGGYDNLKALHDSGELKTLLAA